MHLTEKLQESVFDLRAETPENWSSSQTLYFVIANNIEARYIMT